MLKVLAIIVFASQVLAMPGLGGLNWVQWASGSANGWPAMGPWNGPAAPNALPAPTSPFGKAGMSIGALNKQLGMAQAVIGSKVTVAQDEVKTRNEALKAAVELDPKDPCSAKADAAVTTIDNQLKSAFDPCQMKDEFLQLRLQSLSFKQQMAAFKMAKKACELKVDRVACLNNATNAAAVESVDITTTLTDINKQADDCLAETKQTLLAQVEAATEDLLTC